MIHRFIQLLFLSTTVLAQLPPSPGFPPCEVCGVGLVVGSPDAIVTIPGQDPIICSDLENGGLNGFVDPGRFPKEKKTEI